MGQPKGQRVVILISGGVDSSTTAALLKDSGYDLIGLTMKIPNPEDSPLHLSSACEDAATVCEYLDIPHHILDVHEEFIEFIIEPFRQAYLRGTTPNPCVLCNKFLKFGLLWNYAKDELGADFIATGHYAQIVEENGMHFLRRADIEGKDQSYFLYKIPRMMLPRILFPLGKLSKKQVRQIAEEKGLPVARKSESMDICFLAKGDYRAILPDDRRKGPGPVFDMGGGIIAEHNGIENYTLGQRRGLGFSTGFPVYVVRIDPARNSITVGTSEQVSEKRVHAGHPNILAEEALNDGRELLGKIRSKGEPNRCELLQCSAESLDVQFKEPQFAPTPGQHLVIYDQLGNVLAGGEIQSEAFAKFPSFPRRGQGRSS